MAASSRVRQPIPDTFETLDELDAFWTTHSLADYEDEMDAVTIEVQLDVLPAVPATVTLAPELAARLLRRAHDQGVSVLELLEQIVAEALPK